MFCACGGLHCVTLWYRALVHTVTSWKPVSALLFGSVLDCWLRVFSA